MPATSNVRGSTVTWCLLSWKKLIINCVHKVEESNAFIYPEEKTRVIDDELNHCGYFVIVTSEKMSAKEAIELYKSRDASEKLFRGDKSYLGDKSLRVYSEESASTKIFIEF